MARGKFSPVKDRNDKPVAGAWQGTISWEFANWTAAFVDQTLKTIVTLGTDSRPRNCRKESTPPSLALRSTLNCAPAQALARMLIARAPPNTVSAQRELVFESGQLIGGPEAAKGIGEATGQALIGRKSFALTIDSDGKVSDCALTEGDVSNAERDGYCADVPDFDPVDPGVADRSPRRLIIYWAEYFRPRGS